MPHEIAMGNGPEVVREILPVSRETIDRLEIYVSLVRKWQRVENLIAPSTLPTIWHRHVADCAQLVPLFPEARRWLDLGTGAGFPGLVIACLLVDVDDAEVHLIESNKRKCAFLRTVIRETGVPAMVHEGRVEDRIAEWQQPVDRMTARALAPLPDLLGLAAPLLAKTPAAFFKGADFMREIEDASQFWDIDLVEHKSRIDERGVILDIRRATLKETT